MMSSGPSSAPNYRETIPSNYLFAIDNFDSMMKADVPLLESRTFEVQKRKWKLQVFPHGNPKAVGKLSLYLTLAPEEIPFKHDITLFGSFFLYNPVKDRYLMIPLPREKHGDEGCNLHGNRTSCGVYVDRNFISDVKNGFLLKANGKLTVGVEFTVNYGHSLGEEDFSVFSANSGEDLFQHTWTIDLRHDNSDEEGDQRTDFVGPEGMRWGLTFNRGARSLALHLLPSGTSVVDRLCFLKFQMGISGSILIQDEELFKEGGTGHGFEEIVSQSVLTHQQNIGHIAFKVVFVGMSLSTIDNY